MTVGPGPAELAVVFPAAGPAGGVERVAAEFLRFESTRRATVFVGTTLAAGVTDPGHPIEHRVVRPRAVPAALRPLAFRRAATPALADAQVTVSFGVECPPGDVYWVHSVHAAWLRDGGEITVRGRSVPARARRLLARHQVLMRLERDYFTRHRPRLILCTSPREADDLAELYDVPRALMHVVPNGVDGTRFSPARRAALRPSARTSIGATADDVVVLLVANEWHRKGLGTLLEAVAATGDRRLRVDLVGLHDPVDYRRLAERLGVRMAWHGASDDVAPYYAAADLFALPTTYEPFGIVVLEAMAMGLPVVVSALAGAAAAVQPGRSGLLLSDPRDPAELASALVRLTQPDERSAMGTEAAVRAAPYDWTQVLTRVDDLVFPGAPGAGAR